ncbi:hypothetical protein TNCV_5125481 [Trichonephila clavipes]|nr:hypothetical protein TNCV_5125481 [Trichonephila clavipes]
MQRYPINRNFSSFLIYFKFDLFFYKKENRNYCGKFSLYHISFVESGNCSRSCVYLELLCNVNCDVISEHRKVCFHCKITSILSFKTYMFQGVS